MDSATIQSQFEKWNDYFDPAKNPFQEPDCFPSEVDGGFIRISEQQQDAALKRFKHRKKMFLWQDVNKTAEDQSAYGADQIQQQFNDDITITIVASKPLPFYGEQVKLVHFNCSLKDEEEVFASGRAIVFPDPKEGKTVVLLDGESPLIHELNERMFSPKNSNPSAVHQPQINDENVEEYLTFFCEHIHGDGGGFYVVEEDADERGLLETVQSAADLPIRLTDISIGKALHETKSRQKGREFAAEPTDVFVSSNISHPVVMREKLEDGWAVLATIFYSGAIFRANFKVLPHGMIEMLDDAPISSRSIKATGYIWPAKSDHVRLESYKQQSRSVEEIAQTAKLAGGRADGER